MWSTPGAREERVGSCDCGFGDIWSVSMASANFHDRQWRRAERGYTYRIDVQNPYTAYMLSTRVPTGALDSAVRRSIWQISHASGGTLVLRSR
jgi:hypothetical protein